MMAWRKIQPAASVVDLADIRFHSADCGVTADCDICTCGAVSRAAFADDLQSAGAADLEEEP